MDSLKSYRITIKEKNFGLEDDMVFDSYYYKAITEKQANDLAVLHFWTLYSDRRKDNGGWIPSSDFNFEFIKITERK
jgi:hypothetical protein